MRSNANRKALAYLRDIGWARELVRRIDERGGAESAEEPMFFEARYAAALARQRVAAEYEFSAGVDDSTIDFRIPGEVNWLVELVSIQPSVHVKAATNTWTEAPGIEMSTWTLTTDAADSRQTPAAELIRVIDKIGEKVYDRKRGAPTKFPKPLAGNIHMIVVDMRGFEGVGQPDALHIRQLGYGPSYVPGEGIIWDFKTREPVRGIFEVSNDRPAARLVQERIHYLAFVSEETYADDELRTSVRFVRNSRLLPESKLRGYPLCPAQLAQEP